MARDGTVLMTASSAARGSTSCCARPHDGRHPADGSCRPRWSWTRQPFDLAVRSHRRHSTRSAVSLDHLRSSRILDLHASGRAGGLELRWLIAPHAMVTECYEASRVADGEADNCGGMTGFGFKAWIGERPFKAGARGASRTSVTGLLRMVARERRQLYCSCFRGQRAFPASDTESADGMSTFKRRRCLQSHVEVWDLVGLKGEAR